MSNYWERRKNHRYYTRVRQWLERFSPGKAILDVGCYNTPVVQWGNFKQRYTVDLNEQPRLEGVIAFQANWLDFKVPTRMSVITCLQVIEHISHDDMKDFTTKLFDNADRVIISVPYLWEETACHQHVHDPIDMVKFINLIGREPHICELVTESRKKRSRLVAVFGNHQVKAKNKKKKR